MSAYLGAIDQGTTSTRFIVFDRSGRIVSVAQKEHEQIYPKPGWVEHDPEEIWRRTEEVISEAMQQRGFRPKDLAAIGITNQRETTSAVSVLCLAGIEAGLADQRGLLVAKNSGHRHSFNGGKLCRSIDFAAGNDSRQDCFWNPEDLQQFFIPAQAVEIHQLSAASIGDVRCVNATLRPSREFPEEVRIDVPKRQVAALG